MLGYVIVLGFWVINMVGGYAGNSAPAPGSKSLLFSPIKRAFKVIHFAFLCSFNHTTPSAWEVVSILD